MINPFTTAWHTGDASFDFWLAVELSLVASTILGVAQQAPYGKLANSSLGNIHLSPRFGWWLMEIPASVSFLATYFLTPAGKPSVTVSRVLAFIFLRHYGNRGWVFPYLMRVAEGSKASFSLAVSLIGAVFTALHGHLNAKMFRSLGTHYTDAWLTDPRFVVGLCTCACAAAALRCCPRLPTAAPRLTFAAFFCFAPPFLLRADEIGFWLTIHSEHVIRQLRPPPGSSSSLRDRMSTRTSQQRYAIPTGGAFRLVTNAQYLGELTAWLGFAILTWSLPGLAVFLISSFNLVPRAFHNHAWYERTFGDEYKKLRRARLIPGLL